MRKIGDQGGGERERRKYALYISVAASAAKRIV